MINWFVEHFLVWWLRSGRYGWSRLHRRLFERRYLSIPLPAVSSLEEIEACINQVQWTADSLWDLFDCISYPQVTWARKKDDCDGFACLSAALLKQVSPGFNPVLVTAMLRPVKESHTVCVFNVPEGGYYFFDNNSLRRENCPTYDEVVKKVSSRGEKLVCWDVRNPDTLDMIEFHQT